MHSVSEAIDRYEGELARLGRTPATRKKYREILYPFADHLGRRPLPEVSTDDCRRYLDRWTNASASTLALYVSVLRGFLAFCKDEGWIVENPMDPVKRPRRKRPEDLDVVTVSSRDVERLIDHCHQWDELLCVTCLCYIGGRRNAAAMARRRDVDLDKGTIRLREKGGKIIEKPIPDELAALIRAADENHVWPSADGYLIPNRRQPRRAGDRSNKIIYARLKEVAARAGVNVHPHALRAAFAVQFDEQNPGEIWALKELLGHSRIETTLVYLRRKNRAKAMESVRSLRWGNSVFPPHAGAAPIGSNPAFEEPGLPPPVRRKLEELRARSDAQQGVRRGR
jgi:integrase